MLVILMGILGACIGSFLNVLIYRLPIMIAHNSNNDLNIVLPSSHCPTCKTRLIWLDLIPIFSFFYLKKKCRFCKTKLSNLEPCIEFLTAIIFITSLFYFQDFATLIKFLIIFCICLTLFIIDIQHQLLPDALTLSLLWSGLIASCIDSGTITPCYAINSAVIGYCGLKGFVTIYELIRNKPAMGGGDFKLFAAIAAWTGYLKLPLLLFIASFLGALCTIIWRIVSKKNIYELPLAFGPWLIISWGIVEIIDYATF